jgi:hypothetical protein
MLRISHCLDNGLTDGGEVVGLVHRPFFIPQKYTVVLISVSGCVAQTLAPIENGRIKYIENKFSDLMWNRTGNLQARDTVSQTTMLP